MLRDQYKNRSIAVRGVLALIVLVFIVRLLTLQLSGDYKDIAEGNAFYRKTLYAPRGLIYDRNGKLLVYNQPTYDLMVTVKEMRDAAREGNPLDTAELCALVGMTVEQFEERMEEIKNLRKNPGYSLQLSVCGARDGSNRRGVAEDDRQRPVLPAGRLCRGERDRAVV